MGQNGYHIEYSDSANNDQTPIHFENRPIIRHLVFNDSLCYRFLTEYGGPKAHKNGIYGSKPLRNTSYFSKKNNQWYYTHKKGSRKNSRLIKTTPTAIEWRIQKDSVKTILGYHCTKAWGLIKGRVIYIWYTNDIPYNYGVYGHSFPGLVLGYDGYFWGRKTVATKITKGDYKIEIPDLKIEESNGHGIKK